MAASKRFGPFEVDLQAGQLRMNGKRIHLQDLPFRLLALLMERPGEVVTREELREQLWSADTFVEFEHGLNTAANRLRTALHDSAADPKYIETVPKRGYRFIATVDESPIAQETETSAIGFVLPSRYMLVLASLISVFVVFALAIWIAAWSRGTGKIANGAPLRTFRVVVGEGLPLYPTISHDGQLIAYVMQKNNASAELWVHHLRTGNSRVLARGPLLRWPLWSPNSDYIAYFSTAGTIYKVSASAGAVIHVATVESDLEKSLVWTSSGFWTADGNALLFHKRRIYKVPSGGGTPVPLTEEGDEFTSISRLPVEDHVLVSRVEDPGRPEIGIFDLRTRRYERVANGTRPFWSLTGHILFLLRGHLWAIPFDLNAVRATGPPFLVREHVDSASVSDDGTLVVETWQMGQDQLVWRDRKGNDIGGIGQPQDRILYPVLSPDEKLVAVNGEDAGTREIWIHSTEKEQKSRFTFYPNQWADRASWSPGGDKIAYTVRATGVFLYKMDIYVKQLEEKSKATLLVEDAFGFGWSRDENFFAFVRVGNKSLDIFYLRRNHDDLSYQCFPFAANPNFDENAPALSPNDRYLAYGSNKSGRHEVYVSSFPEGRDNVQVSLAGGTGPRWRADGRELYYIQEGEIPTLMAVPATISGGQLRFGTPGPLFSDLALRGNEQTYDVSSDGQRFVLRKILRPPKSEIVLIQNWFADFRDRS